MEEKTRVKIKRGELRAGEQTNWWPYLLIGVGVIFLLSNFGIIAGLFRLWPLILIAGGVMLLFGRTGSVTVKRAHFDAPVGDAASARVRLNLSVGRNRVGSVKTPDKLIEADITHVGDVEFAVTGEQEKLVSLSQSPGFQLEWLNPANWFSNQQELRWDIGLNPDVPTDLDVNGGVGEARLDLSSLHLTGLEVGGGVGEIDLTLPGRGEYDAYLKIGVGEFRITAPSGASANLHVKGGVGECTVNVPADAAVRVRARMGLGDISVPSRMQRVSDDTDGFSRRGVWETPDFASAERQIVIDFDGGVGALRVR